MASPTIVLIHGAFGDASSWQPVFERLVAEGSITDPNALAPYVDEMRVVRELKAEGVMKAVYRRAAGPGAVPPPRGIRNRRHKRPSGHPGVCCRGPHDP